MIKLIASDVDGTLLPYGSIQLGAHQFAQIEALLAHGIRFAAASGRQYASLKRLFAPVADKIDFVCENGSVVVYQGQIIFHHTIPRPLALAALRTLQAMNDCEVLWSGVHTSYVQSPSPAYLEHLHTVCQNAVTIVDDLASIEEDCVKLSGFFIHGNVAQAAHTLAQASDKLHPVVAGPLWVDVLDPACDKGTGLSVLQRAYGIPRAQTMVFGDNENDIALLQQAGLACAMRNGSPKLLPYADTLIDKVDDYLTEFLLSRAHDTDCLADL